MNAKFPLSARTQRSINATVASLIALAEAIDHETALCPMAAVGCRTLMVMGPVWSADLRNLARCLGDDHKHNRLDEATANSALEGCNHAWTDALVRAFPNPQQRTLTVLAVANRRDELLKPPPRSYRGSAQGMRPATSFVSAEWLGTTPRVRAQG